jgi:hypothetical protein
MITHSRMTDQNISHSQFWSVIIDWQYIFWSGMADKNHEWLTFWPASHEWVTIILGDK